MEIVEDEKQANDQPDQHETGLQGICIDNGFDATFEGIEEDHQQDKGSGEHKGNTHLVQYENLQHIDHQVESCCCAKGSGDDEKQSTCFIALCSKSLVEVMIDRCQVELVIKWYQYLCDHNITEYVSDDHLEIGKSIEAIGADIANRSGNRNKSDTRKGGTDHAKSDQQPIGISVADEERLVGSISGCVKGNTQQKEKIRQNEGKKQKG